MITDNDIIKLKKVFATKEDMGSFATKDDLKSFATKDDFKSFENKISKKFATKKELVELRADMNVGFGEVSDRFDTLEFKFNTLDSSVRHIQNTLDRIAGAIQDQRIENGAGAVHLVRHDRQIAALAFATHTAIPN